MSRTMQGIFSLWVLSSFALAGSATEPIRLSPGPHLFLDDERIAEQAKVRRIVEHPARWPEPVVTGPEDRNFQSPVTVVRDPITRRFRMWYGVPANFPKSRPAHLAAIESPDGIHWLRPPRVLPDPGGLEIRYGNSVLDEHHQPLAGFDFADCTPVRGDAVAHLIRWKADFASLQRRPVRLEFAWTAGELYAFDLLVVKP